VCFGVIAEVCAVTVRCLVCPFGVQFGESLKFVLMIAECSSPKHSAAFAFDR